MNTLITLQEAGQSPWLDYIRRGLLVSGELRRMIADRWITGMTSNPSIFEKAVVGSDDYDGALAALARRGGLSPKEVFLEIAIEDIRMAADELRPVWERSEGADGYVSLEADPRLAYDDQGTIAEVTTLFERVDRPNVLIKVPGTSQGIRATEELIAAGINVNETLLFDVDSYTEVAEAYLRGLERRLAAGQPLSSIASVASFFVSRVDTKADTLLPEGSPLRGRVAVANAARAYARFRRIFSGPRWARLDTAGARVQRPLWGSTSTKNPAYRDVLYVEELIGPDTVNTMPESTLTAFLDHGRVRPSLEEHMATAEEVLAAAAQEGVDLKRVTTELQAEGVDAFAADFAKLLSCLDEALRRAPAGAADPAPQKRRGG